MTRILVAGAAEPRRWPAARRALGDRAGLLLLLMMGLYCVIGYVGYDPSKQDEGYIFGIILDYLHGNGWVVPRLAGEPFLEKPPLYYLTGAWFARALAPWLALHDAARLASGFFTAISAGALALAARLTWGPGYGRFAALALLGSAGLLLPAHMLLTDNAQLSGIVLAMAGFAAVAGRRPYAPLLVGTGAGIAFLAKGLFGPAVIGIAALLLSLSRDWRRSDYPRLLALSLLWALPWLLIWPLLLYRQSPPLFFVWFWQNNFGRYFGFAPAALNAVDQADFWYKVLPWATFPVLPLAAAALQLQRGTALRQPAVQLGLAMAVAVTAVLATSASVRAVYALPLLPALALLAAPVYRQPPAALARLLERLGLALLIGFALLSWSLWLLLTWRVTPPLATLLGGVLTADLRPPPPAPATALAALLTALGGAGCYAWRRRPWRAAANWYAGVFTLLAITSLVWIPWVSAARSSYRPLFAQLGARLPPHACLSSVGLGESQRGMLEYTLGVTTHRESAGAGHRCDVLLIDGGTAAPQPGSSWQLVWSGMRAADDHEKFWLFERHPRALRRVAVARAAARSPRTGFPGPTAKVSP